MELREQAFSGVRWVATAASVRAALQLLQLAVLARLLAPADFGTMSVVLALIALVQMFSDLGVSSAIIHERSISPDERSSLYWLNAISGAVLALCLAIAGPWAAAVYNDSRLQPLLALAGLGVLLESLWRQLAVLAQKELRFAALARIEMAAAAAGLFASVAVAMLEGGVYALMAGVLAGSAAAAALAWPVLARGWRPRLHLNLAEIRRFVRFGTYMIGNNLANAVNLHIDALIGVRMLGPDPMGLYGLSKNLCLQVIAGINPIITRVALPVMAKSQDDAELLRPAYLQIMRMTASANFPIFMALGVFSAEIVRLALGPQWDGAVPLLQILTAWGLLRSTGNPVGALLMARGRADLSFRWNIAWLFIFAPAVWLGALSGAQGIAYVLTGLGAAGLVPNWFFLVRPLCGARFAEYFRELAVPLALACVAAIAARLAVASLGDDLLRVSVGVASGALVYMLLSVWFNPGWLQALLELLLGRRARHPSAGQG